MVSHTTACRRSWVTHLFLMVVAFSIAGCPGEPVVGDLLDANSMADTADVGAEPTDDVTDATPDTGGEASTDVQGDTITDAFNDVEGDIADASVDIDDAPIDASADQSDVAVDVAVDRGVDAPDVACPSAQTRCSGACVDTATSASHCGGCGVMCSVANASPRCAGGMCGIGTCNDGFSDCDMNASNGCEANVRTSVTHCGRCGSACPAVLNGAPTCIDGACGVQCNTGFVACGGACVNLLSSSTHCGRCGNTCLVGQSCLVGSCNSDCVPPALRCEGSCVSFSTDVRHCGRCSNPFPHDSECVSNVLRGHLRYSL
jgi:hypothetical protein